MLAAAMLSRGIIATIAKYTKGLISTRNNVVEQITIKTDPAVKTRIDLLGNDAKTGNIVLTEAKSSATSPLTRNKKLAFPEIAETVGVGKGKEPFVG